MSSAVRTAGPSLLRLSQMSADMQCLRAFTVMQFRKFHSVQPHRGEPEVRVATCIALLPSTVPPARLGIAND